jgi:RimJ/RimL family protein N-acetyltransferase
VTVINRLAQRVRSAGFDFHCFYILRLPLDPPGSADDLPTGLRFSRVSGETVAGSPSDVVRDCAWYAGEESYGFALVRDDRIVCLQWIWFGARFAKQPFWTLGPYEAASVHLVTVPEGRGRGYATHLKRLSAEFMRSAGFVALYSRVWWTNFASLRVNEKAGWSRIGLAVLIKTPWGEHQSTWRWPRLVWRTG